MNKSKKVAVVGLFAAIIVVLQILSYVLPVGAFNLSFVLIPIIIGAVLYGVGTGVTLGAIFGIVVTVACITGLDKGGLILWGVNPFCCALVCIVKGAAAGLVAGLIGKALKGKNLYLACIVSAVAVPVTNTGLFILGMLAFFKDTLYSWSGGTNLLIYIILSLVGINFVIELAVNLVFAPAVTSIIKGVKKI